MARIHLSEQADSDIDEILQHTKHRWGHLKYWDYFDLIQEALATIAENPDCGRSRSGVRPNVLAHHIKQPGRNARHMVFYVLVQGQVFVLRVLHDSMDFDHHLP